MHVSMNSDSAEQLITTNGRLIFLFISIFRWSVNNLQKKNLKQKIQKKYTSKLFIIK